MDKTTDQKVQEAYETLRDAFKQGEAEGNSLEKNVLSALAAAAVISERNETAMVDLFNLHVKRLNHRLDIIEAKLNSTKGDE